MRKNKKLNINNQVILTSGLNANDLVVKEGLSLVEIMTAEIIENE